MSSLRRSRTRWLNWPIFPASDLETCALSELALPGDFQDVLSLARLVEKRAAKRFGVFLESLGARTLSLQVYVEDHALPALDSDDLPLDKRRDVVALLAQRWGEMSDDQDAAPARVGNIDRRMRGRIVGGSDPCLLPHAAGHRRARLMRR